MIHRHTNISCHYNFNECVIHFDACISNAYDTQLSTDTTNKQWRITPKKRLIMKTIFLRAFLSINWEFLVFPSSHNNINNKVWFNDRSNRLTRYANYPPVWIIFVQICRFTINLKLPILFFWVSYVAGSKLMRSIPGFRKKVAQMCKRVWISLIHIWNSIDYKTIYDSLTIVFFFSGGQWSFSTLFLFCFFWFPHST